MREKDIRSCKYCGETFLHWVETSNGWRLFNIENKMHRCEAFVHKEKEDKKKSLMSILEEFIDKNKFMIRTFDCSHSSDWDEVAENTGDQDELF